MRKIVDNADDVLIAVSIWEWQLQNVDGQIGEWRSCDDASGYGGACRALAHLLTAHAAFQKIIDVVQHLLSGH